MDLGTILVIILILGLLGVIPTWGYSRFWLNLSSTAHRAGGSGV